MDTIINKKYRVRYAYSWSTETFTFYFDTLEQAISYCRKNGVSLKCIYFYDEVNKRWDDSLFS